MWKTCGCVMLLLLLPRMGEATELADAQSTSALFAPTPTRLPWLYLTRLEATTLAFLPRSSPGADEGFLQLEPTLTVDTGSRFGFSLGAPLRLRLWGGQGPGALVRREDWDSLSDFGQLVRSLRVGSNWQAAGGWAGRMEEFTFFLGHLVRRYSNQMNPDYHPAGAFFSATPGPFYLGAFTSDVLAARLMGAVLAVDVEHVLFGKAWRPGRYSLSVSAVHDWGLAGGVAPSVTLAHMDAMAVVIEKRDFEIHLVAGWGGRPGQAGAWGAVVGLGVDRVETTLDLHLRLQVRRQQGGFRQGFFGPDYELARFQAAGPLGLPLADTPFPDGYSFYGELWGGWDAVRYAGLKRHLQLSVAVEAFNWGRYDVDGRVAVQLLERNLEVGVKGLALGMGQPGARYLGAAEVRARFLAGRVYVLGTGGTLLFPQPDGTLRPGAFASVGLGADVLADSPPLW
jgi:hypothetical protein